MAPTGRFAWYDLLTTDIDGAVAFYTETIGWKTQVWDGPKDATMPPYTMWCAGQTPIGGVMPLPEQAAAMGAPSHWLAYVTVPDADATVDKAKSLGAQVYSEPMDIPEIGRFAVLADPQGAVFAVISPESDMLPAWPPTETGNIGWHELMTSDIDGAFDFYGELFGWTDQEEMSSPDFRYHLFGFDDLHNFGGIGEKPEQAPMSFWLYYALVDDIDSALGRVKSQGGQVHNGPMDVPGGGRIAQCMDPQGAMFAVYQAGATEQN